MKPVGTQPDSMAGAYWMVGHSGCCSVDVPMQASRDREVEKLNLELDDLRNFKAGLTAAFSTAAFRDIISTLDM